jgi:hypothetical protein
VGKTHCSRVTVSRESDTVAELAWPTPCAGVGNHDLSPGSPVGAIFLCEAALAWGWITLRILPNEAERRIHFGREGNSVLEYFFLRKALPFDPRALSPSRRASQSQ